MNKVSALSACLTIGIGMSTLFSASVAAETLVEQRVENFKKSSDAIKAVFKTHLPAGDFATIRAFGEEMAQWGKDIPSYFPPEATSEGAKPAIWKNWSDFQNKAADFSLKASAVVTASAGGDAAAIGDAVKALGGACKACHDSYRNKK